MRIFRETTYYYWLWEPVYEKFKTITVTDYCDCCGSETGSHTEKKGVNLLRYDLKKYKKTPMFVAGRMMEKMMIESIMAPSILDRWSGTPLKVPKIVRYGAFPPNPEVLITNQKK